MTKQLTTTEIKRKNNFKLFVSRGFLIIIILAGMIFLKFYKGYKLVQPEKYGVHFNENRVRLGVEIMPDYFELSKTPISTFLDYYNATGIYSAEFSPKGHANSNLYKIRIDVDESNIGLIREYRFVKEKNDTICQIVNYYER